MTQECRNDMTQECLHRILNYDPETGFFTWKPGVSSNYTGLRAGTKHSRGYRTIRYKGRHYIESRLAWLYIHGFMPFIVDHINRDKTDNRIVNLRPATRSQNRVNAKFNKSNTSGFPGVSMLEGKWTAYVRKDRKQVYLGRFDTAEQANEVRVRAHAELHGEEFVRITP